MPYFCCIFLFLLFSLSANAVPPLTAPISVNQPAKGVLLVAKRSMPDPRFQQTVILLLEHDAVRGTLGLVLNRPTDLTLADVLLDLQSNDKPVQAKTLSLGWGGPVSREHLFMLLQVAEPAEESIPVFANIVWSASAKVLETVLAEQVDKTAFRVFLGLASWAPGQLDNELAHSGWQLFLAQTAAVFGDNDPVELWRYFIDAPVQVLAQNFAVIPITKKHAP